MSDVKKPQKKEWSEMTKTEKTVGVIIIVIIFFIVIAIFTPSSENNADESNEQLSSENVTDVSDNNVEQQEVAAEETPQIKMFEAVTNMISDGHAFDTGSYVKGDIPKGDYAFVSFEGSGKYYSEEDAAGNIIDNENFDSFGYVYVHEVGNLKTDGVLIKAGEVEKLGVASVKEVYEALNNIQDYQGSAWYKVGSDLQPGPHTIESIGSGYVAIMTGPVGNSEIIDNENFNGKYSVNVTAGQYLKISGGQITQ